MAQAKEFPGLKRRYQNKWLISFDPVTITIDLEDGTTESHVDYKEISVDKIIRDEIVPAIIRLKYNANEESKMLRLGISEADNTEFLEYNSYVEDAKLIGRILETKQELMTEDQIIRYNVMIGV